MDLHRIISAVIFIFIAASSLTLASPSSSPKIIGSKTKPSPPGKANPPPPPTPQPKFPIDKLTQFNMIAPPKLIKEVNTKMWSSMISRLMLFKKGFKIRNVISIKFDETPPPVPTPATTTTTESPSASAGRGARMLSFMGPPSQSKRVTIPQPPQFESPASRADISAQGDLETSDVGVCSTIVKSVESKFSGTIYFPRGTSNRRVNLYRPLAIRGMECRYNKPAKGNGNEKCIMVGYPHGAWVRVIPRDFKYHNPQNCVAITGSEDKACWDYVTVPGYCVMKNER